MLRAIELIPPKPIDMLPVAVELRRFDDYLLQARGFARSTRETSIRIVGRFLRDKFNDGAINLSTLTPHMFVIFLPHRLMSIEHR